jgi:hypothetical protein
MAAPQIADDFQAETLLNRVLIYSGLPKIPSGHIFNSLLNADEEIAYSLLIENARMVQSKGLWFNTVYDFEVPANESSPFYSIDHEIQGTFISVLNVINKPRNKCMDEDYTLWTDDIGNQIRTVDYNPAMYKGYIDYVYSTPLQNCPDSFTDYVVKMTAQEFSGILGQPFNPDVVAKAEYRMTQDDAKNSRKPNVYRR